MWLRLIAFLLLNFTALAIGSFLMDGGVTSDWYANLNKAPWTPPGWVFGSAWTTIMVCFAIFMAKASLKVDNQNKLLSLFTIQWFLNVAWNPLFFKYQLVFPALIVITLLAVLVGYFLFGYRTKVKAIALLVLPYFVWLLIATSLNAYILLAN